MHISETTRQALDHEVLGEEFQQYFGNSLRRDEALSPFESPASLLAFLHEPSKEYARKDAALRGLLRAYQDGGRNRAGLGAFLLLALWPGLWAIVRSKWEQYIEKDALWAEVQWALLETAWHYPLDRRPSRVARNLQLDALNRLCASQRESRRHRALVREVVEAAERRGVEGIASDASDPAREAERVPPVDAEGISQALLGACDHAVAEGLISDLDRLLILGTRLYGRELKAVAGERGIEYQAAKKRRQRAEKVVRTILVRGGRR